MSSNGYLGSDPKNYGESSEVIEGREGSRLRVTIKPATTMDYWSPKVQGNSEKWYKMDA